MSEVSAFQMHRVKGGPKKKSKSNQKDSDQLKLAMQILNKATSESRNQGPKAKKNGKPRPTKGQIVLNNGAVFKTSKKFAGHKASGRNVSRANRGGQLAREGTDSSDGSTSGDGGRNPAQSKKPEIECLNGDDVPLVEEVMSGMHDDESSNDHHAGAPSKRGKKTPKAGSNLELNGDNFMKVVLKSNSEMMTLTDEDSGKEVDFSKKLRKAFKLKENGSTPSEAAKVLVVKRKGNHADKRKGKKPKGSGKLKADEMGSVEMGKSTLGWMIHPLEVDQFLEDSWENRPIHIKRGQAQYYKDTFSTQAFDDILRQSHVMYGKNLDVTSFSHDQRETHNPVGRAYPPVVWDFYNNGCSLRMLNPQTFHQPVWKLCATLQEFFGSMVGANIYLTPPGTQGFAPHFDDVEVFILQLEGKKHWRLYEPRTANEKLPRFSSTNFSQAEIGEPILDIVLEAGDMLYMPRGTIHQGDCFPDVHSLHITISCHQLNTFGDLLEKVMPIALQNALQECEQFRRGLPTNYLSFMGIANSDSESPERSQFIATVQGLMGKLFTYAPVDAGVDQMGKRFMHDALPPCLTPRELTRCSEGDGEKWCPEKMAVVNRVEIDPDTEIRLLRANCLRLVTEEDEESGGETLRIYHCVDNTRQFHEVEEGQFLEIERELAPAIEALLSRYPQFIKAEDLPLESLDEKMRVVQDLWERKLIMTRNPLENHYDDVD
eukprot:maker-scaffold99_size374999-snap-gene-2.25 protein:Tk10057 transcript:maker-scaffold99_size374999-snap-gene-2.25-mRNA-1 annotation:"nucleolar protein 66"